MTTKIIHPDAVIEEAVEYHDGPRTVSVDFNDENAEVVCVHSNGMSIDVAETECLDHESLIVFAMALPDFIAGVFGYLNAPQARELATSLNAAADHLEQHEATKQLERGHATVN